MHNEHKSKYIGTYKAKVHIDSSEVGESIDLTSNEFGVKIEQDNSIDVVVDCNPAHPGPYTYDQKLQQYIPIDVDEVVVDQSESVMDIDSCLTAFVSSGFDFKTLEEWDKIKKN
jgi:hypothetical protein